MENTARIIQLKQPQVSPPRSTQNSRGCHDTVKYYTSSQIKLLRRTARDKATLAASRGNKTPVREWMVIDLISCSGLRVNEAADIRCGDVNVAYGCTPSVFVRNGKGGKSRIIIIPTKLKQHLKQFLSWKKEMGEPVQEDDHLFIGQRGPWTRQAIQQIIKKYLKMIGIYERGKAAHALRHSFAVELYRKEHDLRAVQLQLGHSSLETTKIYTHVLTEDLERQLHGLWQV